MLGLFARSGLLILAAVLLFLSVRLHSGASGKSEKFAKIAATVGGFCAGLAFLGTFVGGWMAGVTKASPYIAAAMFLLAAGGLMVDWWKDGKPDRFAFWCAVVLPMATVFGFAQLGALGDELGRSSQQVSTAVEGVAR